MTDQLHALIGGVGIALTGIAYLPYLIRSARGTISPHPYSWFIWALTTGLIAALQFTSDGGPVAWMTGAMSLACGLVWVSALYWAHKLPDAAVRATIFDRCVLLASLVATALWLLIDMPLAAMVLLVTADALGVLPSARSAWNEPWKESASVWGWNALRHALSVAAISSLVLVNVLNPVVCALSNGLVWTVVLLRGKRLAHREPQEAVVV